MIIMLKKKIEKNDFFCKQPNEQKLKEENLQNVIHSLDEISRIEMKNEYDEESNLKNQLKN